MKKNYRGIVLILSASFLVFTLGCGGRLEHLDISGRSLCLGEPIKFIVSGEGTCSLIKIHYGDGEFLEGYNVDFGGQNGSPHKTWEVSHIYNGWPGPKTIRIEPVTNCTGLLTRDLDFCVRRGGGAAGDFEITMGNVGPTGCYTPAAPLLRKNTVVNIQANPYPYARVNFGCLLSGCVYGIDGELNSSAPNGFPFPGFRKYSLVLRIGTQIIQGGTDVTFTTSQAGPLELCFNDDILSDNTGTWQIFLNVDETKSL